MIWASFAVSVQALFPPPKTLSVSQKQRQKPLLRALNDSFYLDALRAPGRLTREDKRFYWENFTSS